MKFSKVFKASIFFSLAFVISVAVVACSSAPASSGKMLGSADIHRVGLCDWQVMPVPTAFENAEAAPSVAALVEDGAGRLWAGTDVGVFVAERAAASAPDSDWMHGEDHAAFAPGVTHALALDPEGRVWRGTETGTLDYFEGERWQRVVGEPGQPAGEVPVRALTFAPDGSLWVGYGSVAVLAEDVLVARRAPDGIWTAYAPAQVLGPSHDAAFVTALAVDAAGHLWAAGDGAGYFDGEAWTWFPIADRVFDLVIVPVGDLDGVVAEDVWVGTSDGVQRYVDGVWQPLESHGPALGLAVDSVQYVWAANGDSISRYRPDGGLDRWFVRGDGLPISLDRREDGFGLIYIGAADTVWLVNQDVTRMLRGTWPGGKAIAPTPTPTCDCL